MAKLGDWITGEDSVYTWFCFITTIRYLGQLNCFSHLLLLFGGELLVFSCIVFLIVI